MTATFIFISTFGPGKLSPKVIKAEFTIGQSPEIIQRLQAAYEHYFKL